MTRADTVKTTLAMFLALLAFAGTVRAESAIQPSPLRDKTFAYQRSLAFPVGAPLSQRALLATTLAASELRLSDAGAFDDAYRAASAVDNYRPLSDTLWSWITDHWEYATRTTYTYDGEAFPIEVLSEQWEITQWIPQSRITTEYDGQDRQTTITTQIWSATELRNALRTIFEYGPSGGPSVTTTQTWNAAGGEWVNQTRTETSYTGSLLVSSTLYLWENDAWDVSTYAMYEYDANDWLMTITTEADYGGGLENASQTRHLYDPSGNLIQSTMYSWSTDWVATSRLDYVFDGSNREIVRTSGYFLGPTYTPSTSDTTKYDGDRISETVHVNHTGFPLLSRRTYMYDDNAMTETAIDQDWDPNLSAGPTAGWVNMLKEITVYEEFATAVQIDSEPWSPHYELGQNFPNPFNPTTVIQYSLHRSTNVEITIYNVLGRHVVTLEDTPHEPGVYETRWDGTDASGRAVPSGVYFYRLTTDEQTETRKMLLLK